MNTQHRPARPSVDPSRRYLKQPINTGWISGGVACNPRNAHLWDGHRDGETPQEYAERARKAKALCRLCPAQDACLEDALTTGDVRNIRGGREPHELNRLRKQRAATKAAARRREPALATT